MPHPKSGTPLLYWLPTARSLHQVLPSSAHKYLEYALEITRSDKTPTVRGVTEAVDGARWSESFAEMGQQQASYDSWRGTNVHSREN
jgi:hypothetical protein